MTRIVKKNRSSEFKDDMTCRHCETGPEELQKHLKTSTWTESERREPGDISKEENRLVANMKFSIIEKVKTNDQLYRKEREKFHINQFNTHYKGLNKKP